MQSKEKFQISNRDLLVCVNSYGAELNSLKKRLNNVEYIWQANPDFWSRHAPILFPIVGKLNQNKFQINGKEYSLSQHGFARDLEFKLANQKQNYLEFSLSDGALTEDKYPFQFLLLVSYELNDNQLKISYKVQNTDNKTIYFSIGGHPAFNCPLELGEKRSDYHLYFSHREKVVSSLIENGLLSGKTKLILNDSQQLCISEELFDEDALIFENLQSDCVTLKKNTGQSILSVKFSDFPYLGIWSKNQSSPFVCIEPWCGLADNIDHDGNFKDKKGVIALPVEETFESSYSIIIH